MLSLHDDFLKQLFSAFVTGIEYVFSLTEKVIKAECIFALTCVAGNYSFRSNDGNNEVFQNMFLDSEIAKSYAMHKGKCTYSLTHGVAPFLKDNITKDAAGTPFCYLFDETTTIQVKKQYDGYITYFSNTFGKVVSRYLGSIFCGHCTADDLFKHFNEVVKNSSLDKNYLMQLGMDGEHCV